MGVTSNPAITRKHNESVLEHPLVRNADNVIFVQRHSQHKEGDVAAADGATEQIEAAADTIAAYARDRAERADSPVQLYFGHSVSAWLQTPEGWVQDKHPVLYDDGEPRLESRITGGRYSFNDERLRLRNAQMIDIEGDVLSGPDHIITSALGRTPAGTARIDKPYGASYAVPDLNNVAWTPEYKKQLGKLLEEASQEDLESLLGKDEALKSRELGVYDIWAGTTGYNALSFRTEPGSLGNSETATDVLTRVVDAVSGFGLNLIAQAAKPEQAKWAILGSHGETFMALDGHYSRSDRPGYIQDGDGCGDHCELMAFPLDQNGLPKAIVARGGRQYDIRRPSPHLREYSIR